MSQKHPQGEMIEGGPRRGPTDKYREVVEWVNANPEIDSFFVFHQSATEAAAKKVQHSLYMALRDHAELPPEKRFRCLRRPVKFGQCEVLVVIDRAQLLGTLRAGGARS